MTYLRCFLVSCLQAGHADGTPPQPMVSAAVIDEVNITLGKRIGRGAFGIVYEAKMNGAVPVCAKVCLLRCLLSFPAIPCTPCLFGRSMTR